MSEGTLTGTLAEFAAAARLADLSRSAVHAASRLVLDTLACAVAGTSAPSTGIVASVVAGVGGAAEATLVAGGGRAPCAAAAHVNTHAANALDADDTLLYTGHLGAVAVMPTLAAAERQGSSGADFLAAVAVAYEVAGRIGLSLQVFDVVEGMLTLAPVGGNSWQSFAATVGAGRLLGLDAGRMAQALGITGVTAPPPAARLFNRAEGPRAMTKYSMPGVQAEVGVRAALLAEASFTACRSVLDGEDGYWRMQGSLGFDRASLVAALGESWLVEESSLKPYPSCRFSHTALDLFLALVEAHELAPDEIERVEVGVHGAAMALGMGRTDVTTPVDGQFSIPYLLAVAARRIPPGPAWYAEATLRDGAVRRFMEKVALVMEPGANEAIERQCRAERRFTRAPGSVTIQARGRTFRGESDVARGDPFDERTRLSDEALAEKVRGFCADILGKEKVETMIETIARLEKEPTVRPLAELVGVRR